MTHLDPQSAWSSTLSRIDDPTLGFVILMGATLLCALLLLGRRPRLGAERNWAPVGPPKVAPATPPVRHH